MVGEVCILSGQERKNFSYINQIHCLELDWSSEEIRKHGIVTWEFVNTL